MSQVGQRKDTLLTVAPFLADYSHKQNATSKCLIGFSIASNAAAPGSSVLSSSISLLPLKTWTQEEAEHRRADGSACEVEEAGLI